MTDGQQLSGRQLVALLVLMRLEVATIILPSVSCVDQPRESWVAALAGTLAAVPFGLLVAALARRFPGQTVVQFGRAMLGRLAGTFVAFVYVVFFFLIASSVSREVGEAYVASAMPETPWFAFAAVVLAVAAVAAASGIEVIGRAAELLVVAALALFITVLVLPLDMMRISNLLPVLERGLAPALPASLISFGLFGEMIAGWMLAPYLDYPHKMGKYLVSYVVISGVVLIAAILAVVAAFGPTANSRILPVYNLARNVSVARFLERVEMIPLAIWTFAAWVKIGLFLWVSAAAISQIAGLKDYRPLVFPLAFLAAAVSPVLHEDLFGLLDYLSWDNWPVYACTLQVTLLAVLWGAALLRGGGGKAGRSETKRAEGHARPGRGGTGQRPAKKGGHTPGN